MNQTNFCLGRQPDGAVGSLEILPEIVEAVGDKITVLFNSGIRTVVDIIKALSLGAKVVLIGRPEIVEAVGDKITVLFNSSIQTVVDIIKALSLGAKAVLIGRPAIYGLAVGGKVCCMPRTQSFELIIM
jgi:isopentenyl diphosphate isomerase/L-lactate dehydrogenase-like FMN-dependent dehydrogenase